jgi:hypothetical protein
MPLKKITEAQRSWVKKTIEKWRPRLFLGEWHIDIEFPKGELPGGAIANCTSSATYMEATIRISAEFWKEPKDKWEHIVVHELSHCVTSYVSYMLSSTLKGELHAENSIDFQIEQLTQRIANIAYQQEWK